MERLVALNTKCDITVTASHDLLSSSFACPLVQLTQVKFDDDYLDYKNRLVNIPSHVCIERLSSYRTVQNNPNDPFDAKDNNQEEDENTKDRYEDSCWGFWADSKLKYGWICEVQTNGTAMTILKDNSGSASAFASNVTTINQNHEKYLHLSKKIRIGGDRKVVVSYLVSYDERMAIGQVWFTDSRIKSNNNGTTNTTATANPNIFVGDPVWNITSWHNGKASFPVNQVFQLEKLQFKESLQLQWPNGTKDGQMDGDHNNVEVTFNLKILRGTSKSKSHIDKFKLLGIISC